MPGNPYYDGPVSDHFDGSRFFNPGEPDTDRSLGQVWRWRRTAPDNPWPRSIPVVPVVPDARVDGLRVTMVGHATVLIQIAGLNLLTDPVWSDRASPLAFAGPRRITAPGVRIEDLPRIDAILLSHNHYDHLDVATLRVVRREPFAALSRGQRWRAWVRFTHTGEAGGWWGETLATLTASGAIVLSLTGVALFLDRLRRWRA